MILAHICHYFLTPTDIVLHQPGSGQHRVVEYKKKISFQFKRHRNKYTCEAQGVAPPNTTVVTPETGEEAPEGSGGRRRRGGLKEVEPSHPTKNRTGGGGVPLHTRHQLGSLSEVRADQLMGTWIFFFTAMIQHAQLNVHICRCGAMQMFTPISWTVVPIHHPIIGCTHLYTENRTVLHVFMAMKPNEA